VMQESMSLKHEPSSGPLHIYVSYLGKRLGAVVPQLVIMQVQESERLVLVSRAF